MLDSFSRKHIIDVFFFGSARFFFWSQCQIIFLGNIFLSFLAVDFFWTSARLFFLGNIFLSFLAVDFPGPVLDSFF